MADRFTVQFDGHDITKYLRVTSLNRGIGPSRQSRTKNRINKRGALLLGNSSSVLTHDMGFVLRYDLIAKRRELARIFNVNEAKPLIFSDEPDKYYLAMPTGDIGVDERNFLGFGTITWEVYDGVAYSVEPYTFTNSGNVIEIDNQGSEPMYLDLEAKFKSDCGFLGLETQDGKYKALFGNVEEVDGVNYDTTDLLFDHHFTQDRGWRLNSGYIPPVTGGLKQVGTVSYQVDEFQGPPAGHPGIVDPNEGFVKPTSYGTGDSWHGPTITGTVPADKNGKYPTNWKSEYRADFNTDGGASKGSQVGHNSVTWADAAGNVIAAIVIEDNDPVNERSDLVFYVEGKRVWHQMNTQSFYTNMRSGQYAFICEKIGNEVTFSVAHVGVKKTFPMSDPNVELRYVTWYGAAYKDYPPMTNNLLRALNVRKHNVENWRDIPNKFADTAILKYGRSGRNIFCTVNSFQGLQFRDPGSTLLYAPPGQSKILVAYSDFAVTPEITLTGRAAYV